MTDDTTKPAQLDMKAWRTLDALLASPTKTEAAKALGINRASLYARIDKYRLNDIIAQIPQAALRTLMLHSERAAETLVGELNNRANRMEAAKEILDRVGLNPKNPSTLQQTNIYPPQDLSKYIEVGDLTPEEEAELRGGKAKELDHKPFVPKKLDPVQINPKEVSDEDLEKILADESTT